MRSGSGERLRRGEFHQDRWSRFGGLGGEPGGQRRNGERHAFAAQDAGELVERAAALFLHGGLRAGDFPADLTEGFPLEVMAENDPAIRV